MKNKCSRTKILVKNGETLAHRSHKAADKTIGKRMKIHGKKSDSLEW
jgi:hypothetical protein